MNHNTVATANTAITAAAAIIAALRAQRRRRGITQGALADALGVDRKMINRAEQGMVFPRFDVAVAWAIYLGIPLQTTRDDAADQQRYLSRAEVGELLGGVSHTVISKWRDRYDPTDLPTPPPDSAPGAPLRWRADRIDEWRQWNDARQNRDNTNAARKTGTA